MSSYSDEAYQLVARFAATKRRLFALEARKRLVDGAIDGSREDLREIERELKEEVGNNSMEYLVGSDAILIRKQEHLSRPAVEFIPLTIVEPISVDETVAGAPETDSDIPARAIKLVASK